MTNGPAHIARVAVDVPLAHLDRLFDYAIPEDVAERVVPGVRVRVRFAGRLRDGFVRSVAAESGRAELLPLHALVSDEVVLHDDVAELVRAVADHYAGTFSDVVRLAVPPRHATTEKAVPPEYPSPSLADERACLTSYPNGAAFLDALARGDRPRAAWTALPRAGSPAWTDGLLDAAAATLAAGRGVLLLVPDQRELDRLAAAAAVRFGRGSFAVLNAEAGPAARYRSFLAVSRGLVRLVLGTRAAVFAPVAGLGLIALWDDGDDSYAEPRAPGPHAREVAVMRAHLASCPLLLGAYGRTAEVQALVERGWLVPLELPPAEVRAAAPVVRVAADTERALARDPLAAQARLPHDAFAAIRAGLAAGPVLIQVPRAGYLPALACGRCRELARCPGCGQPLTDAAAGPLCRWCGPPKTAWTCPGCGGRTLRAVAVGVRRTAEEFGKAFPGVVVVQSSGGQIVDKIGADPALVLATPGAEPHAAGGYAAAVLLDADALLRRPDLRAGEEALRRWLAAVSRVRPATAGGSVVVVGTASERAVQALVRLDPAGFAARELGERRAAGFPPAIKLVTIEGTPEAVTGMAGLLELPAGVDVLGPFDVPEADETYRLTLRASGAAGAELVRAVRAALGVRAARKAPGTLRVRVDPSVIG